MSEAAQGRDRKRCFQEENEMTSPILPPQGSSSTRPALAPGSSRRISVPTSTASAGSVEPTVSLDTFPSSPPPEVLDQIAATAQAFENLRSQGHELHFSHDEQSGRATIELRDRDGNSLRAVSPSEALEIAAGKPLA